MNKVMLSFSGGKDSVLALHRLINNPNYEVSNLLITMSEDYNRSSIHGIRNELIEAQIEALNLPAKKVFLPDPCPNEVYEKAMSDVMNEAIQDGVTHVAFGDINLKDIRDYREKQLEGLPVDVLFPLWDEPTSGLIEEFIQLGYKTAITTLDPNKVPKAFLGRVIDKSLLNELPKDVDPCGENGEFHTFTYDGPLFKQKVDLKLTDKIVKGTYYWYRDFVLS
ncbi:Dph6-related ATP pyrophosphatase [Piscibacillus salipiscarius]|uniref:ATP-binding protein n=1 Tax=Piscibacillus salipiscarius TaxID=299480 RepID=A0ABW5Q7W4_9BACI